MIMNLDQDLHERFTKIDPQVADVAAGASAAQASSGRRTAAGRAAAACVAVIALLGAYSVITNLTNNQTSQLETTDPNPEPDGVSVDEDAPAENTPTTVPLKTETPTTVAPLVVDPTTTPQADGADSMTFRIVNVDVDDTLNARSGPGTSFDVVFEFAPDATGVVSTGSAPTTVDGGEWIEVFSPKSGADVETAWVNRAFLEQTIVPVMEPCSFNGPQQTYERQDWQNADGSDTSDATVVSGITAYRFGACIRTIIEFSTDWSYTDNPQRSTALPNDIWVTTLPGDNISVRPEGEPGIDFGSSITGAEVAEARFADSSGVALSTFLYLGSGATLDGYLYGPSAHIDVTFDNANGRLIIDVADVAVPDNASAEQLDDIGGSAPLRDENGLILTEAFLDPFEDQWVFEGLARPFEATIGVTIQDTSGELVDVSWVNGVLTEDGPINGVMTTTWTEALGYFRFAIALPEDVDPATIVVILDPTGGAADEPTTIDVELADLLR